MKEIKFTTSKGNFILVDDEPNLKKFIPWDLCELVGSVNNMTEEQFAEVVDNTKKGEILTCFKDYTKGYYSNSLFTAKESFESLVKSLGWYLFGNPVENWKDEMYYEITIEEAEYKTLYNPILLKKI